MWSSIQRQFRNVAETNAKSQKSSLEILNGIETVKSQNYETKSKFKWQKLCEKFINKILRDNNWNDIYAIRVKFFKKFTAINFMVWSLWFYGYISLGQLIAFKLFRVTLLNLYLIIQYLARNSGIKNQF